jgi:2-epi-5-epi-valiolone synthase
MSHCRVVQATRQIGYEVHMAELLRDGSSSGLMHRVAERRALMVCSPTVARLYGEALHRELARENPAVSFLVLQVSEATKTMDQVAAVCRAALEAKLDRRAVLISVGGGVISDIVTMAASWIRRGIDHLRVPTTLVGQVDAGIGIKGAVNFESKKNYIGVFHPPSAVLVDPRFLHSLPARHVRFGLSEIIKIALVRDAALFHLVEQHADEFMSAPLDGERAPVRELVWRSILGMVDELQPNLYEDRTYERLVDFGHTFSPALESASAYVIHHGDAVAIDMALSSAIATHCGLLSPDQFERMLAVFKRIGLPTWSPLLTLERVECSLTEAARHRGGCVNLVVPTAVGRAEFLRQQTEIPTSLLESALARNAAGAGSKMPPRVFRRSSPPAETASL